MSTGPIGLFADSGEMSRYAWRQLSARQRVVVFAFGPVLLKGADVHVVAPGDIQSILERCVHDGIHRMALVGKIPPEIAFGKSLHASGRTFLSGVASWRPETVLKALADFLVSHGIRLVPLPRIFPDDIVREQVYTRRQPDLREWTDISAGVSVGRRLAALRIGQTLTIAHGMVIAVEAAEGTDRTISRSGLSCRGFVVVKVAGRSKDLRFDVPTVGTRTIRTIARAGGTVLALESGKTMIVNRVKTVSLCDRFGICLVGVRCPRVPTEHSGAAGDCQNTAG